MRDFDELEQTALRRFYEARHNDHAIPLPAEDDDSIVRMAEIAEACRSLAAKGLIDWTEIFGATVGYGRITAAGIIVVDHDTRAFEFERAPAAPLSDLWRRTAAAMLTRYRAHFA